jgi:hypothetical protein
MDKNNSRLMNLALALAVSGVASLITIVLSTEFSWIKLIAWLIFFMALQSPFLMSSKYSYAACAAWLLGKGKNHA